MVDQSIEQSVKRYLHAVRQAGIQTTRAVLYGSRARGTAAADSDIDCPHMISWADMERDLSAWLGNAMQSNALHELYKMEGMIKEKGDETLLADWRKLTTSDHFYYMCTKFWSDGDVHKYFSPYESPYDSYINFMNVLDNVRSRARD
jgi:alpha-amylase